MTTTVHIREIRPSDGEADEMGSVGRQAFTNVGLHKMIFPRGDETREEELRWRAQRLRTSTKDPSKRFVVAVEETVSSDGTSRDQIIGWAQWAVPPAVLEQKSEEDKEKDLARGMESLPDAMDKDAYRTLQEGFEELYRQWLAGGDPRDYWGEILSETTSCNRADPS